MAVNAVTLTAWRHSLIESRKSGVLTVKDQNGEAITYKSDAEMAADRLILESTGKHPKVIHFRTSKGL